MRGEKVQIFPVVCFGSAVDHKCRKLSNDNLRLTSHVYFNFWYKVYNAFVGYRPCRNAYLTLSTYHKAKLAIKLNLMS